MKRILLAITCFLSLFLITGCSTSGYIKNGKYYNNEIYYKVSGEDIEFIDKDKYIEAYGTYSEKDGVITINYTFRNEIDENSNEYGNVIPYNRVDTLHMDEDKLILDKTTIDGLEEKINKTFTRK